MDSFDYRDGHLFAEQVNLADLAATHGTPCYVYSRATLERHWHAFDRALDGHRHLVCYAVKANANLGVLNVLARLGSGFDIVSGGELVRVLRAGGDPGKVVFSGVGKRADEMRGALAAGIRCFNVESEAELDRLEQIGRELGQRAPVSIRVNPDVDAGTHPYIATGMKENKFGVDVPTALALYRRAAGAPHLDVTGVDCHIGSQLTETGPFVAALGRILELVGQLEAEGIHVRHLDLGGGLGVRYRDERPPLPEQYVGTLLDTLGGLDLELLIEPGRAIVANAGILLTRVEYLKHTGHRNFAVVDAAMNDLLRPALYGAWHEILPVEPRTGQAPRVYDVVGAVCETGDFLGKDRALAIAPGDLLAVRSAGAYGFSMSSNYNTRPRAAEVLVDRAGSFLVRPRETLEALLAGESVPP